MGGLLRFDIVTEKNVLIAEVEPAVRNNRMRPTVLLLRPG